jgi:predicted TIM-barrel enzyme
VRVAVEGIALAATASAATPAATMASIPTTAAVAAISWAASDTVALAVGLSVLRIASLASSTRIRVRRRGSSVFIRARAEVGRCGTTGSLDRFSE